MIEIPAETSISRYAIPANMRCAASFPAPVRKERSEANRLLRPLMPPAFLRLLGTPAAARGFRPDFWNRPSRPRQNRRCRPKGYCLRASVPKYF